MKASLFAALMLASLAGAQTTAAPDAVKLKTDLDRATRTLRDWPNLNRYRADNGKVALPAPGEQRVVFFGCKIAALALNKHQENVVKPLEFAEQLSDLLIGHRYIHAQQRSACS